MPLTILAKKSLSAKFAIILDLKSPCAICSNQNKDMNIICVVEEISDLWAIERAGVFKGYYHILGGVLNAPDGVGPDQLSIEKLGQRIKQNQSSRDNFGIKRNNRWTNNTSFFDRLFRRF